jgi:hypothetical protein
MHARSLIGISGVLGAVLLGMSCSGPSAERSASTDADIPARVYHVQLDMTEKKHAAHQTLGAALSWWEDHVDSLGPRPLDLGASAAQPAHIEWKAPYYRVRLGPFSSRTEARSVLQRARTAFPEAFVAPDRRPSQTTAP